jgi:hypothetical protein
MKINMFVIDNKPNEKMVKNAKIEEGMTILYPEICKKNEIEMKIKPKPYIIVKLNEDGTFRAIRITSQSRYGKNCIEIVKGSKEFDSMGLRENSVIMVNSINTIIPNYIIKDIGKCTPSLFLKLKSMLSDIFREELTYHSK